MTFKDQSLDEKLDLLEQRIGELLAERDRLKGLVQDAHFLRQNGERPPGAPRDLKAETWRTWDERAERALRGLPTSP